MLDDLESYSHVDRVVLFIWQSDPKKLRQDIQESKAESRGPGGRFERANSGPSGVPKRKHGLTVVATTGKLASDLTPQAVTPRQPRSGRSSASSSAGSSPWSATASPLSTPQSPIVVETALPRLATGCE